VLAARLAAAGFSAAPNLFEAPRGFGDLFGADVDWSAALDDWTWAEPAILRSGVQVKPFPSCAATHTAIDAMLALRPRLARKQVERIECRVSPLVPQILIHSRPTTSLEAKFSMEYCVAVTLLDGQPGLEQFSDQRVAQADVQALLRRVDVRVEPRVVDDVTSGEIPVQVHVRLADGGEVEADCSLAPGTPERPLDQAQLEAKFLGNAELVLGAQAAARALQRLRGFAAARSVRTLLDDLTCH
jgi:2-methylcitrate dehydratase PrpD